MAGERLFFSWREGADNRLGIGFFWNDYDNRDGKYLTDEWNQHKIDASDLLPFAVREVYLGMNLAQYLVDNHTTPDPDNAGKFYYITCDYYNTNTKWSDDLIAANIYDFPPHCNNHAYWSRWVSGTYRVRGDTNSHVYTADDAKLSGSNKVNINGWNVATTVATYQAGHANWIDNKDWNGDVVLQERITASGHYELRRGSTGPVWSIRKVSPTNFDIYRAASDGGSYTLVRNIRRTGWQVKYISSSNPRRLVLETRNFEANTLVTQTITGNQDGTLLNRVVATETLSGGSATEYYVSPSGNDSNPGTFASPWQTLTKASTAPAGSVVYFRGGTYSGTLTPANSGSSTNPTVFRNYPGETAILNQNASVQGSYGGVVRITNKQWIVVEGLHLRNAAHMGVLVDQGASNIVLRNLNIDWTYSSGVMVEESSNFLVENVEITRATHGMRSTGYFSHPPNEWISSRTSTDGEIKGCYLHTPHVDNGTIRGKEGIDVKTGSARVKVHGNRVFGMNRIGIYADAYTHVNGVQDVEFYNNYVKDCPIGIKVTSEHGGRVTNIHVYNNILVGNLYDGVWVDKPITYDSSNKPLYKNVRVINNTIVGNSRDAVRIRWHYIEDFVVRNNIFWQNTNNAVNLVSDGSQATPSSEVTQSHNQSTNPLFVDAFMEDYRLQASSPAIDAGTSTDAPIFDFAYSARPVGTAWDVGAYEYGSQAPPPDPEEPPPGGGGGGGTPTSIDLRIGAGADDVLETPTGGSTSDNQHRMELAGKWGGFRFTNVQIPQGATVTDARLTLYTHRADRDNATVNLYGENADNSAGFVYSPTPGWVSGRAKTSAVQWVTGDIGNAIGSAGTSPNLASAVQTIVNRSGWAQGNSLTLLAEYVSGDLQYKTFEALEPDWYPRLQVTFEVGVSSHALTASDYTNGTPSASTPSFATGLVQQSVAIRVEVGTDDAYEHATGGSVSSSSIRVMTDGYMIGLRFQNVPVPQGAVVTDARLRFWTNRVDRNAGTLAVYGHAIDNDTVSFVTAPGFISNRPKTNQVVNWVVSGVEPEVFTMFESPDISTVVQEIVSRVGWAANNTMGFILPWASGDLEIRSRDGSVAYAPELMVTYSVEEQVGGAANLVAGSVGADASIHGEAELAQENQLTASGDWTDYAFAPSMAMLNVVSQITTPVLLSATTATGSSSSHTSDSLSPSSNALLLVIASNVSAGDLLLPVTIGDTFSGGSLTWTLQASAENTQDQTAAIALFTAPAGTAPGTGTITVTWSANGNRHILQVLEIRAGYDALVPVLQAVQGSTTASALSLSLTTAPEFDSMIIGAIASQDADGVSPGVGYVELVDTTVGDE
jgi:hypothetical protein